jgi:hypothetical protein
MDKQHNQYTVLGLLMKGLVYTGEDIKMGLCNEYSTNVLDTRILTSIRNSNV